MKITESYTQCLEIYCKMGEWMYPDAIALSLGINPQNCEGIINLDDYKEREKILISHINSKSLTSEPRISIDIKQNVSHQSAAVTPSNFIEFLNRLNIPYPQELQESVKNYSTLQASSQSLKKDKRLDQEKNKLTPKEEVSVVKILAFFMAGYYGDQILEMSEADIANEIVKKVPEFTKETIHYQTALKYVKQANLLINKECFSNKAV